MFLEYNHVRHCNTNMGSQRSQLGKECMIEEISDENYD